MKDRNAVTHEAWIDARKELLAKEKALTHQRDLVNQARRELPWVKVEKHYEFDSEQGTQTLADLFGDKSQLVVYHFMYGPQWEAGCPSCSFLADQFDGITMHLTQRDISLVVVSRAPLSKLLNYRDRMGWKFKWVSANESDFNVDYHVSFTEDAMNDGRVMYNYHLTNFPSDEAPGVSVFCKNDSGDVFHTYSSYARGLDMLIGAYQFMDLVPKGRDEDDLPFPMDWVRRKDEYER